MYNSSDCEVIFSLWRQILEANKLVENSVKTFKMIIALKKTCDILAVYPKSYTATASSVFMVYQLTKYGIIMTTKKGTMTQNTVRSLRLISALLKMVLYAKGLMIATYRL